MRRLFLVMLVFLAITAAGCSGNKAKEIYDTAQLEELQNNPQHAWELYEEIIRRYPDSEYARKAGERLSVLKGSEGKGGK